MKKLYLKIKSLFVSDRWDESAFAPPLEVVYDSKGEIDFVPMTDPERLVGHKEAARTMYHVNKKSTDMSLNDLTKLANIQK